MRIIHSITVEVRKVLVVLPDLNARLEPEMWQTR